MRDPFTFGIPLIARHTARRWQRVEALLGLTLSSLLAQSDREFRIVIAGHDRPDCTRRDERISFLSVDWEPRDPELGNLDAAHKKESIKAHVLASGGGLLMFVDADDWIDARLVEAARRCMSPSHAGGVILSGCATDLRTLRTAPLPDPELERSGFHRICGSSTIVRLVPDAADPLRRDPHLVLHEHYRFLETARHHALEVARLPVAGCYLVNTAENHSELHGPFVGWRRSLNDRLNTRGRPLDASAAARFGLDLAAIRAVSSALVA